MYLSMKKAPLLFLLCTYLLIIPFALAKDSDGIELDVKKIEELTGEKGVINKEEKAFKITVPRDDLTIDVNETKVPTGAGIASWVAFKKEGKETIIMGDLLLLQDQINPVITALLNNGLEITALHNHLLWENPRIMFMHIEGIGSTHKLAYAIGKVFSIMKETATKKNDDKLPTVDSSKTSLDATKLDAILDLKGTLENNVYKIVVGREAKVDGFKVGKTMGINAWAAFTGSEDLAMLDGDIPVTKEELQKLLTTLNKNKLSITAIHQHMVGEEPHYLFVHFYGVGKANNLAKAIRTALDIIKPSKKE